ncbi:hypothetical protein LIER_27794 [Lithospermum erythrorhizon]|uniref:Uncharacterized protein n=1 Tax=Lithospermum erythrorhizon TaxID=34254 RepID=A0AAV3RDD9_LITER
MFIRFKNRVEKLTTNLIGKSRGSGLIEVENLGVSNPHIMPDVPDESCDTNSHASCSTSNLQVDKPRKSKRARVEKTFGDEFITNFF